MSIDKQPAFEDQSYAKTSLGVMIRTVPRYWESTEMLFETNCCLILVKWLDQWSLYNPLRGIWSLLLPSSLISWSCVILLFKVFCQQLCEAKLGWDDPLIDELLARWSQLLSVLKSANAISVPQCVLQLADLKVAQDFAMLQAKLMQL